MIVCAYGPLIRSTDPLVMMETSCTHTQTITSPDPALWSAIMFMHRMQPLATPVFICDYMWEENHSQNALKSEHYSAKESFLHVLK